MKEVLISFLVFIFCISITIFSQVNSPKVVNAAQQDVNSTSSNITKKTLPNSSNNIFELDP